MNTKRKKYARVKCDCGHYPKDHHAGEGWCNKCGCTWYYPNVRYIMRKRREKDKSGAKTLFDTLFMG